MSVSFDWGMINRPRWTALSAFGVTAEQVVPWLLAVSPCIYAMTNADYGTPDDPGVGAFLWAGSVEIALLVYERQSESAPMSDLCPPPPPEVLGFDPPTYGAALALEKESGAKRPRLEWTYRMTDGVFLYSGLSTGSRKYIFRALHPKEEEPIVAIRFDLPQLPDAWRPESEGDR